MALLGRIEFLRNHGTGDVVAPCATMSPATWFALALHAFFFSVKMVIHLVVNVFSQNLKKAI
jgi:hypothetical protein